MSDEISGEPKAGSRLAGWVSIMDEMPPLDTVVETKGGGGNDDEIIEDYFHSTIGDWMNCPGDPTHWRVKTNDTHEARKTTGD